MKKKKRKHEYRLVIRLSPQHMLNRFEGRANLYREVCEKLCSIRPHDLASANNILTDIISSLETYDYNYDSLEANDLSPQSFVSLYAMWSIAEADVPSSLKKDLTYGLFAEFFNTLVFHYDPICFIGICKTVRDRVRDAWKVSVEEKERQKKLLAEDKERKFHEDNCRRLGI